MTKIKDTQLAAVGTYFGLERGTENTQMENITSESLKKLANIYQSIPLTVEHDSKQIIGYVDNLHTIQDMLLGDLNIYEDVDIQETCLSKFISPEFLLDKKNAPKAVVYMSIVEDPAITENLPILTENDLTVLNAKKNSPHRFQKNQKVEIADGDACERCKKLSQKTRSKPVTYAHAKSMLPLHPNCRCKIQKV